MDSETDMVRQIRSLDSDMQTLVYENYNKFISATGDSHFDTRLRVPAPPVPPPVLGKLAGYLEGGDRDSSPVLTLIHSHLCLSELLWSEDCRGNSCSQRVILRTKGEKGQMKFLNKVNLSEILRIPDS